MGQEDFAVADLRSAADARNWGVVIDLLDRHWTPLLQSDPKGLAGIIQRLPDDVKEANPRWALAGQYIHRLSGGGDSRTLRVATSVPLGGGSALVDRLADLTSSAATRRGIGDLRTAVALVEEARGVLAGADDEERETASGGLADLHHQWGQVRELAGDYDGAVEDYEAAYRAATSTGHVAMQFATAGALAWISAIVGRSAAARAWLARLPAHSGEEWWYRAYSTAVLAAEALLLADELRFDEAREVIASIDPLVAPERWATVALVRSRLVRARGDAWNQLSDFDARLGAGPAALGRTGSTGILASVARANLLAVVAQFDRAEAALGEVAATGFELDGLLEIEHASVLLLRGNRRGAHVRATRILATGPTTPRIDASARVLAAAAAPASETASVAVRPTDDADDAFPHWGLALVPAEILGSVLRDSPDVPDELLRRVELREAAPDAVSALDGLTARERAVVAQAVAGASRGQIAAALFVSENTVKSQLRRIYQKVGVSSLPALVRVARDSGFRP
jgi:DNA-binding CsgD family transcriptional regulator